MKFNEFKKVVDHYCDLANLLTPDELESFLAFMEVELQKEVSPEKIEKFDMEYNYYVRKWVDKHPEEMEAMAKKLEITYADKKTD